MITIERQTRRQFMKSAIRSTAALGVLGVSTHSLFDAAGGTPAGKRISYYRNGELHVNIPGEPEGKPLTTGHWDFKPSWSKTGDMLVFFRRLTDNPDVGKWITAVCIIKTDGSGFHQLSDGTRNDFNPTWTRDGKNTPLWNRKTAAGYCIMASRVGGTPGEETALTDPNETSWVHSAVIDGRLFIGHLSPARGRGYFLSKAENRFGLHIRAG